MNERVKMIRKQLGMTQEQLAQRLGIGKAALSMIETGKAGLSARNRNILVQELNVNPEWLETGEGEMFNADVNARLIENIFFKNSPLHDGAMIIADNRIKAAGCILPVAQNATLPKDMGLRHRSGLGMSLETDALVIIVSEERGKISVAHKGKLSVNVTAEELQQILSGEREVTNYC